MVITMTIHKPQSRAELTRFHELVPETTGALRSISRAVGQSDLEPSLKTLVVLRASQINGCAFCLNMHLAEAQDEGESAERIQLLCAWRETPLYTERERAALAWTEALTLVTEGHVPDAVYEEACRQFSEKELALLTSAIVAINAWNRIGVAYRWTPQVKPES
jgi:AhpD family alkylhydroperoxidase